MSRYRSVFHVSYIVCLFLVFPALALLPVPARAHGPGDVTLQYNADAQTLTVAISHGVSNPEKHYVKTVTITKNGQTAATHTYTSQPEGTSFTYTYPLEAKKGDVLKVTADCNRFGSRTGELTISQ